MDVLLTAFAPAFSLLFGDMQFTPLRQRAAADQLKAEGQGAGFDAGKCPDLKPHAGHPSRAGLLRLSGTSARVRVSAGVLSRDVLVAVETGRITVQ